MSSQERDQKMSTDSDSLSLQGPIPTSSASPTESGSSSSEILQAKVFGNEVILRHLFSVVPLTDLKTYREVCCNWRRVSETEFKKRSVLKFDFRRTQSVFNMINKEAFTKQAESYFTTFNKIVEGYPDVPRDSFFFVGPIAWEDKSLQEFFKRHGKEIKNFSLELRISSPAGLITLQNIIFEYLPNIENLTINWATETQFIVQRMLEYTSIQDLLSNLKHLVDKKKTPNNLKTLHIRMLEGNLEGAYFIGIQENALNLFYNLISNANCLTVLDFTDSFSLDLKHVTPSCIPNLQEIRFKMLGRPTYDVIKDIIKLSGGCPRLNSFSIEYSKASANFVDLEPLLRIILYPQRNNLKKLRIYWEPSVDPTYEAPIDDEDVYLGDKKVLEFPKMQSLEVLDISYNLLWHNSMYIRSQEWMTHFPALKSLKFRYNVQKCAGTRHPFLQTLEDILNVNETITSIVFDCSQTATLWKGYSQLEIKDLGDYYQAAKLKFPNLVDFKIIEQEDGLFKYSVHSYCGTTNDHCSFLVDFKYYNNYLKCN